MDRLTRERAEKLLHQTRSVRVLVIGDLMLDRYLFGSVDRISPEAPVPVVRIEGERAALGGAGNVAANILALGAACEVIGCVGTDPEGALLVERLGELGVGTDGVLELSGRATTVKTRIMARHQHVTRLDREDAADIPEDVAGRVATAVQEESSRVQSIILEDYNKGMVVPPVIRAVMAAGTSGDLPVVVDPKRMRFFEFGGATVFKPNARELEDAIGEPVRPDDPEWMGAMRDRLACENLLLTLGERGMALGSRRHGHLRVPTVARDVYDVSGAGDTVTAVMAVLLALGASAVEAAILANHAAAVEVGRPGVATVSPEEILANLNE